MIALTNIGLKRMTNQDYARIIKNAPGDTLGILCDGLGGHNSGEVASEVVVEHFLEEFKKLKFSKSTSEYVNWIRENIDISSEKVFEMSSENPNYSGMGTTLVLSIITKDEIIIANIGDSRAYVVDDETIKQMSEDHTLVNMKVKMGQLSIIEALNHPDRNVVMQAIGIEKELYPHIISLRKEKFSKVILFCDGVTDYVSDNFIESVMINRDFSDEIKGKVIIEKALESGGKDNISIVILDLWGENDNR